MSDDITKWLRNAADEYEKALTRGGCYAPEPDWDVESVTPGLRAAASEIERLRADRRERIATACLAALLSVPDWDPGPSEAAKTAVRYARALIAELDEEAKP